MTFTEIGVPDDNDSMSQIVIDRKVYYARFTWNDRGSYWKFGLYDALEQPIVLGMKVVPGTILNTFLAAYGLPLVGFTVRTRLERVGRLDFAEGRAAFGYYQLEDGDME